GGPTGSIWAQAIDDDTGEKIPNYRFCAIPYSLAGVVAVSGTRSLNKTCFDQDPATGRAEFALPAGNWFIFPMGRPGTVLSAANGTAESYRDPSSLTAADYAYPAVVRRFDYDFNDD